MQLSENVCMQLLSSLEGLEYSLIFSESDTFQQVHRTKQMSFWFR